jgi:hypothetical protein
MKFAVIVEIVVEAEGSHEAQKKVAEIINLGVGFTEVEDEAILKCYKLPEG